jgi:ABC-2 type transport system permease protein
MLKTLQQRYRYATILLKQLVKTDFKLRYQSSFLGYLWSLLKPLFLFAIMYAVFVKVLRVDYGVPYSGVYLLLGIVLWSFFAEMTGGSVMSIVGKGDLMRKLNFPRYVIVLSNTFSALINFLLNMIVVAMFMIMSKVAISSSVILVPIVLVELILFGVAVSFFLATSYVKLRDIGYIWDVIMQALFYITPIFFPLTLAPIWAQKIIMLSPLSQAIQDIRFLLVSDKTVTISTVYGNDWIRVVPVTITIVSLILSLIYFKSQSKYFAEDI